MVNCIRQSLATHLPPATLLPSLPHLCLEAGQHRLNCLEPASHQGVRVAHLWNPTPPLRMLRQGGKAVCSTANTKRAAAAAAAAAGGGERRRVARNNPNLLGIVCADQAVRLDQRDMVEVLAGDGGRNEARQAASKHKGPHAGLWRLLQHAARAARHGATNQTLEHAASANLPPAAGAAAAAPHRAAAAASDSAPLNLSSRSSFKHQLINTYYSHDLKQIHHLWTSACGSGGWRCARRTGARASPSMPPAGLVALNPLPVYLFLAACQKQISVVQPPPQTPDPGEPLKPRWTMNLLIIDKKITKKRNAPFPCPKG